MRLLELNQRGGIRIENWLQDELKMRVSYFQPLQSVHLSLIAGQDIVERIKVHSFCRQSNIIIHNKPLTKTQIRCPKLFCVLSKDSPMLILPTINVCINKARAWGLIKGDKTLSSSGLLNVNILLSVVLCTVGCGFIVK